METKETIEKLLDIGVADGIIRDQSARIAELEAALRDIIEKEEEYRSRPSTKTGGAATRSIRKAGEVLRGH